jgi:hypothetical protein
MNVIKENLNFRSAAAKSLEHLAQLCRTHAVVRARVATLTPRDVEALLLAPQHEKLRASSALLLMSLVPSMPATLATQPAIFRRVTLRDGTDLRPPFDEVSELSFDASRLPHDQQQTAAQLWHMLSGLVTSNVAVRYAHGQQQGQDSGNWQLASFVRVLRWLLHSREQAVATPNLFDVLHDLYVGIDKLELIHDNNKAELIQLLLKMVAGVDENVARLARQPAIADRLMNW